MIAFMRPHVSKVEGLATFFTYLLVAFLPFSNAVVETSATVVIVLWIVLLCLEKRFPAVHPLYVPLVVFLLFCGSSILWTTNIKLTAGAFFYKWLEYILLFFAVADLANRKRIRVINAVWIFIASGSVVACDGLAQYVNHRELFRDYALYANRITAAFTNPNDLGGYIATVMILVLGLGIFLKGRVFQRVLLLCGIAPLSLVCLIMTGSRGAWLGAFFGVVTLIVLTRRKIALVAAALIMASAFLMPYLVSARQGGVFHAKDISVEDRQLIWKSSLRMLKEKPILGHGLGTFMENYPRYRLYGYEIVYAHNCFLQIAAETGLASLIIFLWALMRFFVLFWRRLRREAPDIYYRAAALGLAGAFQVSIVQSLVDTNLYALRMAVLFWLVLALGTGALISPFLPREDERTKT